MHFHIILKLQPIKNNLSVDQSSLERFQLSTTINESHNNVHCVSAHTTKLRLTRSRRVQLSSEDGKYIKSSKL